MSKDFGKKIHKMNQLKKRLKRSRDNQGHSTPLKDKLRLKRIIEIKKEKEKRWKPKKRD